MGRFAVAPESSWIFAPSVPLERRDLLLHGRSYERTVVEMFASCSKLSFHKQHGTAENGARCIVTAHVAPASLDRFFNASCGYRAQYLVNPGEAHQADRYAIEAALSFVLRAFASEPRRDMHHSFVEASLSHPWADVWPYQGLWLGRARLIDRILQVPSWQAELSSASAHRRKLARWGSLAPDDEPRLQLNGGYVLGEKHLRLGKPPAQRTREIGELGFT